MRLRVVYDVGQSRLGHHFVGSFLVFLFLPSLSSLHARTTERDRRRHGDGEPRRENNARSTRRRRHLEKVEKHDREACRLFSAIAKSHWRRERSTASCDQCTKLLRRGEKHERCTYARGLKPGLGDRRVRMNAIESWQAPREMHQNYWDAGLFLTECSLNSKSTNSRLFYYFFIIIKQ